MYEAFEVYLLMEYVLLVLLCGGEVTDVTAWQAIPYPILALRWTADLS